MNAIACGQFAILGDGCPQCEASIHRYRRGGYADQHGVWYCSEDCIADHQEWVARKHTEGPHATRDLLCDCTICTARGLPTQAMLDEYADYQESIKGTELDPGAGPQRIVESSLDGGEQ